MANPSRTLLTLALGLAAGVAFALLLTGRHDPAAPPTPPPIKTGDDKVAALEARLRALEAAPQPVAPVPAPSKQAPPPTPAAVTRPTLEQRQAEDQARFEQHNEQLRAHEQERFDTTWAPEMSKTIEQDFVRIDERLHAKVARIDCRDQTCVAELVWPSRDEALKSGHFAVELTGNQCASQIFIPPDNGAGEQRASVLYDCRQR